MLSFNQLLSQSPLVMGILNVTPDSFSDGGQSLDCASALDAAFRMIDEGAHIIDIGGESTRPGYTAVDSATEKNRVLPVIERLKDAGVWISIDSRKTEVAAAALQAGARMINNVSSTSHTKMAALAAKFSCPLVITADQICHQTNPLETTLTQLRHLLKSALQAGVKPENLILDIGLGFGKTSQQNLFLLKNLAQFKELGYPLLVGASRKAFIGEFSNEREAKSRLGGSLAAAIIAMQNGADILRVHDVAPTVQAVNLFKAYWNMGE